MVENRQKIVIDSSLALKWVLNESDGLNQALFIEKLIQKRLIECYVPSIFFSETLNILFRKAPEKALRFLSQIRISDIMECRLSRNQALKAGEIMQKYPKISFYDASYHALAIDEDATFITADKKYYETTKKEGSIELLENFSL